MDSSPKAGEGMDTVVKGTIKILAKRKWLLQNCRHSVQYGKTNVRIRKLLKKRRQYTNLPPVVNGKARF